jgi:hypothetical protein
MNVDCILETMNRHGVNYLLIGGMNFMLRFEGILTYDVDFWIEDAPENLLSCERALVDLDAEWGRTDEDWGRVADRKAGWLSIQGVYSLASREGPVDIFRSVKGLDDWNMCWSRAEKRTTPTGVAYSALGVDDLLRSQEAVPTTGKVEDRLRILRSKTGSS